MPFANHESRCRKRRRILIHQGGLSNPNDESKMDWVIRDRKGVAAEKIRETLKRWCTYPLLPRTMTLSKVRIRNDVAIIFVVETSQACSHQIILKNNCKIILKNKKTKIHINTHSISRCLNCVMWCLTQGTLDERRFFFAWTLFTFTMRREIKRRK